MAVYPIFLGRLELEALTGNSSREGNSNLKSSSVTLTSADGISYRKTNMTQTQTINSYRIDRRTGKQGSRSGVTVLAPDFEKYITEQNKRNLLKCKRSIKMSTFNVRTMQPISQISELIATAEKNQIDVISVQEHRFYHDDLVLKYHEFEKGWTFISASAWKNTINSTIGGIGMLLSPHATKSLNSIEKITSRILVATFNGNPEPTVITCYSPTNITEEQEVIAFYDDLSSLVRSIPKHNVLIIAGDLNAQVGHSQQHKFTFHDTSNRNGEYLEHFLIENGLLSINTRFQKRRGKLWTFKYPNGQKGQLDYMMINKKWINSIQNCEAYHCYEGISTDHRMVSLRIQLSLRANKKKSTARPIYDWKQLVTNENLQNQFSITLKNRYSILQQENTNESANLSYQSFMQAHKETAELLVPRKEKVKLRIPWENEAIVEKRKKLKKLAQMNNRNSTRTNAKNYKQAQKDLEATYLCEQQKYIQSQIDKIENASENKQSSSAWQTVNEITGRKKTTKAKIKASSQKDRINKWKNHFSNLLGKSPTVTDSTIEKIIDQELPIKTGQFEEQELDIVLKNLKNKKAAGLDEIPPEVWKTGKFNDLLLYYCNSVYKEHVIQP